MQEFIVIINLVQTLEMGSIIIPLYLGLIFVSTLYSIFNYRKTTYV